MTPKNKWISFFLCLFLGALGIHKFYEGRVLLGIVYIFTGGLFGIGYIFDPPPPPRETAAAPTAAGSLPAIPAAVFPRAAHGPSRKAPPA